MVKVEVILWDVDLRCHLRGLDVRVCNEEEAVLGRYADLALIEPAALNVRNRQRKARKGTPK